ncbi:MAG: hypothetical protein JNJ77_13055 [Planctomycetia bacterium]|nr:hypothetical protein [Planctomycetia bacterium]
MMYTVPFKIPLNTEEFESALQKGQGRTLLHVREMGLGEYEHSIIAACLCNQAYDAQCEGYRTDWLLEIVDATGEAKRISQKLLQTLHANTDNFWDACQRCQIALRLAQRGYEEARAFLYSCLRKWPDTADVIGAEEIIKLDGADGLIKVAEYLGTLLQTEDSFWIDEGMLNLFDEAQGAGAGRKVLETAAVNSPQVSFYLQYLDERSKQKSGSSDIQPGSGYLRLDSVQFAADAHSSHVRKMQDITVASVINEIETEDPESNQYWFSSWGRHASVDDLATVFESMILQSDPGRLSKYFRIFMHQPLPTFDARMLSFAWHANPEVRKSAHKALSNYSHTSVRKLVVDKLEAGLFIEGELKLLARNYEHGDAAKLERILHVSDDRDLLHGVLFDLVKVFQSNKVAESTNLMLFVYDQSPCSNCRRNAVELLLSTGTAPDWLLVECQYDSSEEIRLMVKSIEKN